MHPEEFDRVVEEAVSGIPRRFRRRMRNLAVIVEPEPSARQLASGGVRYTTTLLGLYEGRPLPLRSVFETFAVPDRITIFQGPHERLARNPAHLRQLVEETVWHEVAHYFGLNEREIRAVERRRPYGRR
jgi:predicted Zn-dependent protease with MMP-like domain